jgi:hypothetical protein
MLWSIKVGVDALERFDKPLSEYNERARVNKKAQYKPRKIFLIGNHEQRITRAVNMQSELEGLMSFEDFELEQHGWEVVPFLEPIEVDGIYYSHYFVSGVKGESISGMNIASSIVAKNMVSCTAGHNHTLDYAVKTGPDAKKRMGLCAGCFLDEHQHEEYANATEFLWWRGLVYKSNVKDGEYDLETISIQRLKQIYG